MSFAELQAEILDQDLCCSCGACVAVCPEQVLEIDVLNPVPSLRSDVGDPQVACEGCSSCLEVCPGKDPTVRLIERRMFGRPRNPDERWSGIYRQAHVARSGRPEILEAASAGGAVTSLLLTALEHDIVDGVLVLGQDPDAPWRPQARLTADIPAILDAAQATYCLAPTLQDLTQATYERVAVVTLPCQSQAIGKMRQLQQLPEAAARVRLVIEIACSSSTLLEGTKFLVEDRLETPVEDVARLRYRDGPYPGAFTVTTHSGEVRSLPFHELVTEFTRFKTHRCLSCPDWWSGIADLSVADADPNIFKTSRDGVPAHPASLVLTRTEAGAALLALARRNGTLELTPTNFDPERNLGLQRKRHRYERLRKAGHTVPHAPVDTAGPSEVLDDDEIIERLSRPVEK